MAIDWIFPAPKNVTTLAGKLAYIDSLTDTGAGGMLGVGMMLVIFASLFMMMKGFKMETAFAPAAFITAFLGILIRVMLPVSNNVIYISIVFVVIGLLYLKKDSDNSEI